MRFIKGAGFCACVVLVMAALVLPSLAVIPDTDLAFLTSSNTLTAKTPSFFPSVVRPLFAVFIIGSLLFGAMYLSYRRRAQAESSEIIHVLASSPVAQGVIVQIVDVGGVFFVLAQSRNGPTLLGQITDREKISEIRTRVSQESLPLAAAPIPFKKALERLFRKPGAESENPAKSSVRDRVLQEALERVRRLSPKEKDNS